MINSDPFKVSAYIFKGEKLSLDTPCPICGSLPINNKGKHLVIHHWGKGSRARAIRTGRCRRVCQGCNIYLGQVFPLALYEDELTWEEQLGVLFERCRKNPLTFTRFDGKEKPWSIVVEPKDTIIEDSESNRKGIAKIDGILSKVMKTVRKEVEDGKLKVELLNSLMELKEKLDGDGKEPNGRKSSIRKKQS